MVSEIESLIFFYNKVALRFYDYRWYFVLLALPVHLFFPLLVGVMVPTAATSALPFTFIIAMWCVGMFVVCMWLHPEHGTAYGVRFYDELLWMFPKLGPRGAAVFLTLWFVAFPLVVLVWWFV